jgi:Domain of unknown function (DUF4062)
MASRKVVKIFLASPGDLVEERLAAYDTVVRFNQTWADYLGYQVDLIGWEETVSSHGRPQEIINKDLEQCELFFGMLWRRWGTPPDINGLYTSGFEEEFTVSMQRCKDTGRPALKLAFKEVDQELIRDPGAELRKVLAFKDSIIAKKELLFESFKDVVDFREKFYRAIADYVKQLKSNEINEPERSVKVEAEKLGVETNRHVATELLSLQGAQFLHSFIEKTESVSGDNRVSPFEVARLRLLGLIAYKPGNDEQSLGVHDANLIYTGKIGTNFGKQEKIGLVSSGLDHLLHETAPLWHWYKEVEGFQRKTLALFSIIGPASIRAGALFAMTLIGEPLFEDGTLNRDAYLSNWFSDENDAAVKVAALAYLGEWGKTEDLPVVRAELERSHYQTRGAAADALFRINLREGHERSLELLIETQTDSVSKSVIGEIFSVPPQLETKTLQEAILHRVADVRLAAVRILHERKALSNANAEQLLADISADVRMEAMLSLRDNGRQFSDTEGHSILVKAADGGLAARGNTQGEENYTRFKESYLRKMSERELSEAVEILAPFNEAQYLARADTYYSNFGPMLKVAVENEFRHHFDEYLRPTGASGEELTQRARVAEYVRERLTRGGLNVIEGKRDPLDLGLIRHVLKSGFVKWSATDAEYLAEFGEWQDISLLSDMVERPDYGSAALFNLSGDKRFADAGRAIYSLGKKRLPELLALELRSEVLKIVVLQIPDKGIRDLDYKVLRPLVLSKADSVRKVTALKIAKVFTRTQVAEFLSVYLTSEDRRYYNVVHWLDFAVSAPRPIVLKAASRELASAARS